MIIGINTSYQHQGREYHIQCEDLGGEQGQFEIRVYDAGNILWQKRIPYSSKVDASMDKATQAQTLKDMMEKLVNTVKAAIAQGKI